MKHIILLCFFSFTIGCLFAQSDKSCYNCGNNTFDGFGTQAKSVLNIYPNPTTEYIALNDESDRIQKMEFYNLTGRQMRSFSVFRGERYSIGDLPDGVYFVRLIDKTNRVVTTQRVTKK